MGTVGCGSRLRAMRPGLCCPSAQASVLLWAGNCLEVGNEGDKAKLQDVRACSEATGVPVVTVEDTKKLGEWVGVREASLFFLPMSAVQHGSQPRYTRKQDMPGALQ